MKLFKKSTPQNFSDWFEIASEGFSEGVKERIWSEIKSHYSEAVEREMARGFSEAEAQANALVELGAAGAVARSFRKRYLTVKEARQVARARKMAANKAMLICGYFVGFCWVMAKSIKGQPGAQTLAFAQDIPSLIYINWDILVFFLLPSMAFVLAGRDHNNRNTRLIFLFHCIGNPSIGSMPMILAIFGPHGAHPSSWRAAMAGLVIVIRLWPLSLWQKVRRAYPDETSKA
jgi:hypothetical protein